MLGNTLGTWGTYLKPVKIHWELKGNIVRTHWEQGEKKSFPLIQTLEAKKARHIECMLGPSHWLHEISLPRRVCHYLWRGLIPYLLLYRGCWIGPCVGRCEEQKCYAQWNYWIWWSEFSFLVIVLRFVKMCYCPCHHACKQQKPFWTHPFSTHDGFRMAFFCLLLVP
jgi:hypothetical protein